MVRAEPDVFGPVAFQPTMLRLIDRLAACPDEAVAAIRRARGAALPRPMAVGERGHPPTTPTAARSGDAAWVAEVARHAAPWIRVEVRDLHHLDVAAAWLELRAAWS